MKTFSYGALLFVFWISLSGHFEPLLLGLGLASIALTIFLAKRMNIIDQESYPLHLASRLPAYWAYISWEIVKTNIDVIKCILKFGDTSISPQLIKIPVPQKTDLGRVLYANSITLTPGTVSVELTQDTITVHALTKQTAADLATGIMAKAIPDQAETK